MQKEESSDGYSTDENKRKRVQEENDLFRKSKKLTRTPPKPKNIKTETEEMEEMKNMLKIIMEELSEIRKENRDFRNQIKEIATENRKLKQEVELLNGKVDKLEEYKRMVEKSERQRKKNNIIIYGANLTEMTGKDTLEGKVSKLLEQYLNIQVSIPKAHRINTKMCAVELESFEKKCML